MPYHGTGKHVLQKRQLGRILKRSNAVGNVDDQQLLLQHLSGTRYHAVGQLHQGCMVQYDARSDTTLIIMSEVSIQLLPPCTLPGDGFCNFTFESVTWFLRLCAFSVE